MGTISRESFERLAYFRREVEKILHEFFDSTSVGLHGGFISTIPIDILETPDKVTILAELPGFSRGDITLEVMRDTIAISAIKHEEKKQGKAVHICTERSYGEFSRTIDLPAACDTRRISGVYSGGVLKLEMPKVSDRRGEKRTVEIVWEEK